MNITKLIAYLNEDQALALAQFLKRVSFSDFKELASSLDQAYLMQEGALKIADALADNGFNPR